MAAVLQSVQLKKEPDGLMSSTFSGPDRFGQVSSGSSRTTEPTKQTHRSKARSLDDTTIQQLQVGDPFNELRFKMPTLWLEGCGNEEAHSNDRQN